MALPRRLRRLLRPVARLVPSVGDRSQTPPTVGHVRVVDATPVPRRASRRLARRLVAGLAEGGDDGPRMVVLAGPRTAPVYRRAGLTVETVATPAERDRRLVLAGGDRTVRVVPLGRAGPVAVTPVQVAPAPTSAPGPAAAEVTMGPYFVGGTGRSGTWALGRLLATHPDLVTVHTELRFHADKRAFSRLLDGSLTPERYARGFVDRYFGLTSGDGTAKGLQLIASRYEVNSALRAFQRAAEDDLPAAMGTLVHRLVDPYARARRARGWVETTPRNAAVADALTAVLPDAHVIHIVRDGRDVAASIVTMPWGPTDPMEALDLWAEGLRAADAGFRAADPARAHVVRFEELVILDRARTLTDLLDRLDLTERDRIRARFDAKLDPSRSNLGRWRRDAGADAEAAIDRRYREILAELADDGVGCLPVPPDELPSAQVVT